MLQRNSSLRSTPKVLIIISTGIVGGPGKGILQLTGELEKVEDVDYRIAPIYVQGQESTQFIDKGIELGRKITPVKQKDSFDFSVIGELLKIIDDEKINIIQTHGYKEHVLGMILKSRRRKLKWITIGHGATAENRKMKIYFMLERLAVKFSDLLIAVSDALMEDFLPHRSTRKKSIVIKNAIHKRDSLPTLNLEVFPKDFLGENTMIWGAVGRLTQDKGHDVLIKAFSQLYSKDKAHRLVIVGEGYYRPELEDLIDQYQLQSVVFLAGYQADVDSFYAAMDVMVLPSVAFEGLPNVLLESLNASIPVLATPVTGVKEVINDGENGWITPIGDPQALAEKMEQITSERELIKSASANAQASIFPEFSVDKRVQSFVAAYNNLIS